MEEGSSIRKVLRDPLKPVMTRQKLATDPKMYVYALTMNITKPKNIKESMDNHNWIEAMQEIHQFERLGV
ncbi:hypothetical protein Tco_1224817 [Tanacetum coccineum]